ncbi:Pyruvate:ferredoxin oxidoreductase or related 2-oxoacid:ferredoxin oxidoreductase [Commensalibacter communis]|uniref:pyruvate:ferredoxin (flavodoxin) oxidoreductase n=1 Tax=Commensalibacter communis TaxID=2972786 RepID=UPI0022FF8A1B|nr:pyruvate:ferredoxin (flavodoxin) oxidoreductase [Commensalibacter communis]CAI3937758.1 Pyruvate:ferredoxin oxidoreductase or related 2-oxoacid:ferredoxin oxidoreductase [Commensalibacter communis]CAI3938979.1 Pyruvate:ferredoxin oxidoreductase or related 2-oxoacid:ferredoxin oxidoreductase [Commensalibacter communis]
MSKTIMDANTAVAHIAYRVNEVCAIFPITPSSPMAEDIDDWAAKGKKNIWGNIPFVQQMQSEGGAAGTVHGALQSGALTTTFTASQGLLLMLPNMYKIAGELTSTVFHVAARSIATSALSIFGDHSDVMAARMTGFGILGAASVQEAHDLSLITHAATLAARVPFIHFFDGFRTSHELNTLDTIPDDVIEKMIDDDLVAAHRERGLSPENPFIRGTAHNPDTFFQAREAVNQYYNKTAEIVEQYMDRFGKLTGRHYGLVEYNGDPNAEHVIVLIGSAAETAEETVKILRQQGESVGILKVRLYRPFPAQQVLDALPKTVKRIAVMDRTKESGALGEPLYLDVMATLAEAVARGNREHLPLIIGGRYGLSSKDFTPAMVKAVFDELKVEKPRHGFTVGIKDDLTHTSLDYDPAFNIEHAETKRAMFFGLGSDGTVGANKNSVKIISEDVGQYAQGYFVYDSRKAGAQTVSHLRFGHEPIKAAYLVQQADFVGCHQFHFLYRQDILENAADNGTFLLNSHYSAEEVWQHLPRLTQQRIIEKKLKFFVVDASKVAQEVGLGMRTNTILQTCFFAISGVLPRDEAIDYIKKSIHKTYSSKGDAVVQKNYKAVDAACDHLFEVKVPEYASSNLAQENPVPADAPKFIHDVIVPMFSGQGESLPVSLLPADGTFPSGTAAYEKRNISDFVPEWREDLCIQCGQCGYVCPHSVIRAKTYDKKELANAPEDFKTAPVNARGYPNTNFTLQFYVEDCTGCTLCVSVCPASSPTEPDVRAINMTAKETLLDREKRNLEFFKELPVNDRSKINFSNVRGVQFLEPLFEFSGACAGCGETPYLKVLTQLFGDRLQVANATGCSSIYGGNMPVTPWAMNKEGKGPAWSNSLYEDNAEFGLGFRVAADKQLEVATHLLLKLKDQVGEELVNAILTSKQVHESEIRAQRLRVGELKTKLSQINDVTSKRLSTVVDHFIRRSIWIVGGDGWAYDIGYGGLDHVLASGQNVNILVMDTEMYSNTGGQASKASPFGSVAKFASSGKETVRKDLALMAMTYDNVYVAQVAMGASPQHTLDVFRQAEAYDGPSLIVAYSHCIGQGLDMRQGLVQQGLATDSGYWPLFRFDPMMRKIGKNPFQLDSPKPSIPLKKYAGNEIRYRNLARIRPNDAEQIMEAAQKAVTRKYEQYEALASMEGSEMNPVVFGLKTH